MTPEIVRLPNGTHASIKIGSTYDAEQLEELIAVLAEHRQHLRPPVAPAVPAAGTRQAGKVRVHAQPEPVLECRLLRAGGLRLWLRNEGLGWLLFDLNAEQTAALGHAIRAAGNAEGFPNLFESEVGDGPAH